MGDIRSSTDHPESEWPQEPVLHVQKCPAVMSNVTVSPAWLGRLFVIDSLCLEKGTRNSGCGTQNGHTVSPQNCQVCATGKTAVEVGGFYLYVEH